MIYLTEDDFGVQIQEYELADIIRDDTQILDKSELMAVEEMQSYLRSRFDVASIFSQTGDDRNALLIMYAIDLALYHLFSAITPRNVPQIRMDRYDAAIRWLDKVRAGAIDAGLPLKENAQGETFGTSTIENLGYNGTSW